ncbi:MULTISPECIES: IS110 family transposase [unclassified Methylibium]|uniref:IS110 family transposase n=1 Tax=unclassified Methylibium TaxID=2633235 RepID=UPI0003F3D328|nr:MULTISPECIES: IS110 family transposase [unclassified Methylibium]EWS52966.1 Transposase IS116/IS110/IS902 family protein [Methylibium sp. T29]EWS57558.1 Transposase IS116/IS110/IS902 family protein [Methylibium sp. T29-B]
MAIVHIGIDLAKNVFAVHGVDEHGKPALVRPSVPRAKLHELIAALPPCTVAMEACSGGHHWARLFAAHGHTVRLIARKFVAPYRMSRVRGKNDATDAAVIASEDERARQLMRLAGVGPTTATAVLAMIGNGHEFRCGRQFAAWLGLTPGQYSSGGKTRLGRITKAGDAYLRTMLILGARAVLAAAKNKTDGLSRWALTLEGRRGYWKAVVAIAAKNARMCWAMLARGESFKLPA